MSFRWILLAEDGTELRSGDPFPTKEEAEAWMGAHWAELVDEGAASVRLVEDDVTLYDMGLDEG